MKNERIITHFQSYTTAEGCVKDLAHDFQGRISIATPMRIKNAATHASQTAESADVPDLPDMMEIGGIALGTIAYLFPGMSPILTGGPMAGAAIGQSVGSYMVGRMYADDEDETGRMHTDPTHPHQKEHCFVTVEVNSSEEAERVTRIAKQHGGIVDYSGLADANADLAPQGDDFPDGYPQPEGMAQRRIPHEDGYQLDPLSPAASNRWVDPNIGYGNWDLVDPAGVFKDGPVDDEE